MNFQDYLAAVRVSQRENSQWRVGQTHFNVLWGLRPDLAAHLRGKHFSLDPFYLDQNIEAFLEFVESHW